MWGPPKKDELTLGFVDDDFMEMLKMSMLNVDVDHLEQSIGVLHFPQGTYKDIPRHRVNCTYDDAHESIRLPGSLSYQQ